MPPDMLLKANWKKRAFYFPTLAYAPVPENKNVRFSRNCVFGMETTMAESTLSLFMAMFAIQTQSNMHAAFDT